MMLFGCQQENETTNSNKLYSTKDVKESDVVDRHGEISHIDIFESFLENVLSGVKDEIQISVYTTEGDPIFHNLNYDGNKIQYTFDNSQDTYVGSGKGKESTSCSNIIRRNTENGVEYNLSECTSEVGNFFYFIVSK